MSSTVHNSLSSSADRCMMWKHDTPCSQLPWLCQIEFASSHCVSRLNGCHTWQQCPIPSNACVTVRFHHPLKMPLSVCRRNHLKMHDIDDVWNLESMRLVSMWHSRGPLQRISTVSWVNMSSAELLCTCKTGVSASLCADTHIGETSGALSCWGPREAAERA
jgi:hypothetical protein